jgi:hypothetical protein
MARYGGLCCTIRLTEYAVAAAVHGEPARARIARQPVVLRPDVDVGEALEVAGLVLAVAFVAPEEARHAWEGFADDQLACFAGIIDRSTSCGVHDVYVHAQGADLHLASIDRSGWIESYERCGCVCAAGCVADLDAGWERAVEPFVLLWR